MKINYTLLIFIGLFGLLHANEEPKEKKKTICLNMIVKNESKVIERCLNSVKPFIDHWIIVDTGSTDNTQSIIKECLKDIPGTLYEHPWKNFEYNRNHALSLAKKKGDYLLFIDADEELIQKENSEFPSLKEDAYIMTCLMGETRFHRISIVNNHLNWYWKGPVHEVVICDDVDKQALLMNMHYKIRRQGARSQNSNVFEEDIQILLEALKEEPDNKRNLFYLAQSYFDCEKYEEAIKYYKKRASFEGEDEEKYLSIYYTGVAKQLLGYPQEECVQTYFKAYASFPHRAEPLFQIAQIYRGQQKYEAAFTMANLALSIPMPEDLLNVDVGVYRHKLLLEVADNAFYLNRYADALLATMRLMQTPDLSENVLEKVVNNINYFRDMGTNYKLPGVQLISKSVDITPASNN